MPLQPARKLRWPIPPITSPLCEGYASDKIGSIFLLPTDLDRFSCFSLL